MADKHVKKTRKKNNFSSEAKDDLSLQDVLAVGGDKDDFEMVKNVDVSGDFVAERDSSEDIEDKEIMSYIKELGLDKLGFNGEPRESSGRDEEATTLVDNGEITKKQEERKTKRKKEKRLKNKETFADSSVESQEAQVSLLTKKQSLLERKRGPHQKLLITPGGLWYDLITEEKSIKCPSIDQTEIAHLSKEAADLLENEVSIYDKMKAKEKSSDAQWLRSVVSSGTLKDKVAALTIQVQDSAVHRLKTLDILIGMAKKKGRRESILAVDMLKELWMTFLLPSNRKLRSFDQHPLSSLVEVVQRGGGWDERDRRLILWHFEDLLKQRYKEFINIVEVTPARMF